MTITHRTPLTRTQIILELDQEVDRLLQARHLLAGVTDPQPQPGPIHAGAVATQLATGQIGQQTFRRPEPKQTQTQIFSHALGLVGIRPDSGKIVNLRADSTSPAHRQVSPAGRKRMARAQRLRWKKFKQEKKRDQKAQRAERKSA